jgi:ABC-type polysaccharide/polyol phosphate transport system ATPase subunit
VSLPSVSESSAALPARANGRSPIAIKVQDVSVTYRTSLEKKPTFKSTVVRLGRRERTMREIEAVKDLSLEIRRGSVVGIMGANGAGKSTLVRTMAGILPPTAGRVEVAGRVSTLLALGVGFDKDLTGRQNVKLGGLAAGLTREELEAKYDEIVEFAELEEFMDMPMRMYSSGMYGRLGFSVAVTMEPDILLIDEALSVGDARFRKKSAQRMKDLCGGGRTIVLVSHALGTIQDLCDNAIWMHKGELQKQGSPDDVIDAYTAFLEVGEDALTMEDM